MGMFWKAHKQKVQLAVIAAGIVFFELLILVSVVLPRTNKAIRANVAIENKGGLPLVNGGVIEQEVDSQEPLYGIVLFLGTYRNENLSGSLHAEFFDRSTGEMLAEASADLKEAEDNDYFEIYTEEAVVADEGQYLIRLSMLDANPKQAIFVWGSQNDVSGSGATAVYCGEDSGQYLILIPLVGAGFLVPMYLVICVVLLAIAMVITVMVPRRAKPETLFVVSAFFIGLLLMVVYPSYSVHDEERHIPWAMARASAWASGHWDVEDGVGIIREEEAAEGYTIFAPTVDQYKYFVSTFFEKERTSATVEIEINLSGAPYEYTPQIVGILISRLLHFGQTATLYFSQMLALLFYIGLCWIAIKISPYPTMFAILALCPSILRSGGSFSYDCFINAVGFLFVALCLRLAEKETIITWREMTAVFILFLLLAPCKAIYIPLCLLILLLPRNCFKKTWLREGVLAISLFAGMVLMFVVNNSFLKSKVSATGTVVGPWGNEAYSVSMLLQQPFELIRLTVVSAIDGFFDALMSALGGIQHYNLPRTIEVILLVLIVFSVSADHKLPKRTVRLMYGTIVLLVLGLAYAASITWTSVGSYTFIGMQGRYLIPAIPLLILALSVEIKPKVQRETLVLSTVLVNIYSVLYLFIKAIW